MSTSASELVRRIRDHLRSIGTHSIIDLAALLQAADKQGINQRHQLDNVLRKGRVFLGLHDLQTLCKAFNGPDGSFNVREFLDALGGQLSDTRLRLLKEVFASIAPEGRITFNDLNKCFAAKRHIDVERGLKSEAQIRQDFLLSFRAATGVGESDLVDLSLFTLYYEFVSPTLPTEDSFRGLLGRVWIPQEKKPSSFGASTTKPSTTVQPSTQTVTAPYKPSTQTISPSKPQISTLTAPHQPSTSTALPGPSSSEQKARALIIGINYQDQADARLAGCINDTKTIKRILLEKYGYQEKDIKILTDDNPSAKPTRANILKNIDWLVKDIQPGDYMFFHFSGHGGQVSDFSNDETDRQDETILPLDFRTAGMILDDDLHRALVDKIPDGAHLMCLFDSCHSGSVLDLDNIYYETSKPSKGENMNVVLISGCRDDQTSADARPAGGPAGGAMTMSFQATVNSKPKLTYRELLSGMHAFLKKGKYDQKPQLSSDRPLDLDAIFDP